MEANTTSTNGGNESGYKIAIGVLVLTVLGIGAYWYVTKDKPKQVELHDEDKVADAISTAIDTVKETAATQQQTVAPAVTNTATTAKESPIRTNFDSVYNYQKRGGIWYTARKATPSNWISLVKYPEAVAKLEAKYPND